MFTILAKEYQVMVFGFGKVSIVFNECQKFLLTCWKLNPTQYNVASCELKALKEPHSGQGGAKTAA